MATPRSEAPLGTRRPERNSAASLPAIAEPLVERLSRLRESDPYRRYLRTREFVLQILASKPGASGPYWQEELTNIEYLLDASPLIVQSLRHHCFHVTGIRPYDYRSGESVLRGQLKRRLDALVDIAGKDIFVPESPVLGGFGHAIDDDLVNLDTLKYFESLIALRLGGVLDPLLASTSPTIIEIGSGWGGMAYQIKMLAPQAKYILVDLPELFLFSATYLMSVFPEARVAFYGVDEWERADFVFVPHSSFDEFPLPSCDLAVNTVSFQEMAAAEVRGYVHKLAANGVQQLYSLNRRRSVYNREPFDVSALMSDRFALTEIRPLPVPYNRLHRLPRDPREYLARLLGRRDNEYRHLVGRLKT